MEGDGEQPQRAVPRWTIDRGIGAAVVAAIVIGYLATVAVVEAQAPAFAGGALLAALAARVTRLVPRRNRATCGAAPAEDDLQCEFAPNDEYEGALQAELRRLRASNAWHNAVISQLPAIVWTTDADFRVRSMNGGAIRCIPIAQHDSIGYRISDVLKCEYAADFDDDRRDCTVMLAHRRALLGDSVGFDLSNFRNCGRDLDVMVEPLLDECGSIVGCLGIALDVTERRRRRQAERERTDLQGAVAAMEQVLTVIGHELRTPLAALRVMSEHLLNESTTAQAVHRESDHDESHSFLRSIHDEVIQLSMMVNDLLDATHLDEDIAQWKLTRIAVAEVCNDAVAMLEPLTDPNLVKIDVQVLPADLAIHADPCSIRRLLANLLSNAQRHTQRGTISLRARRSGDHFIELAVCDTGAGIPHFLADKLGVPFALNAGMIGGGPSWRENGERRSHPQVAELVIGSGLGLAVCNRIAAAHGGSMRIDSEVGRGTTVTVRLRADLEPPTVQ